MNAWLVLAFAVVAELIGSTCLKLSGAATSWWSLGVLVGYLAAFGGLEHALKTLPLGICYAIWAGLGVVGTALIGRFLFGEPLGLARTGGLSLIVAGVVVLALFGRGH